MNCNSGCSSSGFDCNFCERNKKEKCEHDFELKDYFASTNRIYKEWRCKKCLEVKYTDE